MKRVRSFVVLMIAMFLLSFTSVCAYEMHHRTTVQLTADSNSIASSGYAGNYGKGTLTVISGSAGNAKLFLQDTTGNGWKTLTIISVSPGSFDETNIWGRDDTDYLFRIVVQSDPWVSSGNPGRIAYGYLYTGFED